VAERNIFILTKLLIPISALLMCMLITKFNVFYQYTNDYNVTEYTKG